MRSTLILLVLTCLSFQVFSQNDWRNGYIIQTNGDSLHGYLDFAGIKDNGQQCRFKKSLISQSKVYKPDKIRSYRFVNSKFYVAKTIDVEGQPTRKFLEFLINGEADIYYYRGKSDRYFIEKQGELIELKNTKEQREKSRFRENREYIGVLSAQLADARIQSDINKSQLNHKSLILLSKKYHETVCDDEKCIIYEKRIKPIIVQFGAIAGVTNKTLFVNGNFINEIDGPSDFFGVSAKFKNLRGANERLSFQLDAIWSQYLFLDLKGNAFNIPLAVNYRLTKNLKFYPQVEAGISTYLMIIKAGRNYVVSNLNFFGGISLNHTVNDKHTLYLRTRYETNPNRFRFGLGFLF